MKKREYLKAIAKKVSGKLIAIASGEKEDRQGDKLKIEDWDFSHFKKNPVLLFAHDYRMPPVGIVKRLRIEDKLVLFEPVFHEITQLAREVKEMYESEPPIMKAFSVGFMPISEEGGRRELLEISCVPIPASREALLSGKAKSITDEEEKEIDEWIKKQKVVSIKPYPNEHACRLRDPKDFKPDSFRRTSRSSDGKKYSIIMGRLKGETTMTEQAYRYDKDIWSAGEAKKHCSEHKGSFEAASGKCIPCENLKKKEGRIISGKNRKLISDAVSVLQALLVASEPSAKKPKKELSVDGGNKPKRSKPKEDDKSQSEISDDELIRRALQKIARNSNLALNKINKR